MSIIKSATLPLDIDLEGADDMLKKLDELKAKLNEVKELMNEINQLPLALTVRPHATPADI